MKNPSNGNELAVLERISESEISKALPLNINFNAQYALRVITTEIKSNIALKQADPVSVLQCIFACLQIGLLPGTLGHVYLIPYKCKSRSTNEYVTMCRLQISYQGMLELVLRSPNIRSISADVIWDGDDYAIIKGTEPSIRHISNLKKEDPQFLGVYAVAYFVDGRYQFETMSIAEINQIRACSPDYVRNPANSIWTKHYSEMARKTVLRRLCKYLPKTEGVAQALHLEEPENLEKTQNGNGESTTESRKKILDIISEENGTETESKTQ